MKLEEIRQFLHGGDYNPDQWLDHPEVLEDDIRLMKQAGVNVVTLGVFSWTSIEPQEGVYTFEWLDKIMDEMYENGIYVILSTPSGARPPWLAKKYPEVMRTSENRVRMLYGGRENHCESSEIWREKVRLIDEKLAERYAHHPALIMWHLSNEMYGRCYCEKCAENFRKWLKKKYGTIEELNKQYWSSFWSHKYMDFREIEPPAQHGEMYQHALVVDYYRFSSDLKINFLEMEKEAVKKYHPDLPVTTNMFHVNCGINYDHLAKILDVVSWDSYPRWHCQKEKSTEWENAVGAGFTFDYARAFKGKPFYLMESVPSVPSQFEVCKLKRPKMHMLSAMQTIACGSDSVQYFQWRKSNGSVEKFHGAVIDHNGSGNTRVFRDVCEVGAKLKEISCLKGTEVKAEVALIYDFDNIQALYEQRGITRNKRFFESRPQLHYDALLKNYVNVDVISSEADFSKYKVIAAPMLYLFKPDTARKIREFVKNGGDFVMTYYSGLVNENDLCFSGTLRNPVFAPYSLNDVFGIKVNETDAICDDEYNEFEYKGKNYKALTCCELVEVDGAEILAEYKHDFYKGLCAVSKKQYGQGFAYYIACNTESDFLSELYGDVLKNRNVSKIVDTEYVKDVMVRERNGYIFVMNFSTEERRIVVKGETILLNGYDYIVINKMVSSHPIFSRSFF